MEIPSLPSQFEAFISEKLTQNCRGGRPHFIRKLAREREPREQVLDILEAVWLKDKSIGSFAKKFSTSYVTIYRLIQGFECWKPQIVAYLKLVPRKKVFYNRSLNLSDYETVQAYIRRAKRQELKRYRIFLRHAKKCWIHFNYRDPTSWTADEVSDYLTTIPPACQFSVLVAIRQVAPQIRERSSPQYVGTGNAKEKMGRRKLDLFGSEVSLIVKALNDLKMPFHVLVFELHVATGAREGSLDSVSGLCGVSWNRFKGNFETVDDYESKVKGGIWWRDCPTGLLFPELPENLHDLWVQRGRPTDAKLILGGYKELKQIYREINAAVKRAYEGRVDASLLAELAKIKPHGADKLHVNLLWEAGVEFEVVAGQDLGRGEGLGLVGRGWLDLNTIKNYYLSLTKRSKRFQRTLERVRAYSRRTLQPCLEVPLVSSRLRKKVATSI